MLITFSVIEVVVVNVFGCRRNRDLDFHHSTCRSLSQNPSHQMLPFKFSFVMVAIYVATVFICHRRDHRFTDAIVVADVVTYCSALLAFFSM